jgi:AraC-like DNA-binding protein
MIHINHIEPSRALKPFISAIEVYNADLNVGYVARNRLTHDAATLTILLSGQWHIAAERQNCAPKSSMVIAGPNALPAYLGATGTLKAISISITALGWVRLTDMRLCDIADRFVDLSDVMPHYLDLLTDLTAISSLDKIALNLEAFFSHYIETRVIPYASAYVQRIEKMLAAEPDCKVSDLAAALGISSRQLERIMPDAFGFAPKTVLRRARYLHTVRQLMAAPTYQQINHASALYFDQAHMIREFRKFTGQTPRGFLELIQAAQKIGQLLINVDEVRSPSLPPRYDSNSVPSVVASVMANVVPASYTTRQLQAA